MNAVKSNFKTNERQQPRMEEEKYDDMEKKLEDAQARFDDYEGKRSMMKLHPKCTII